MRTDVDVLSTPTSDLAIGDLWPIYLRRKRAFYFIFGGVVLLAILYCCIAPRKYSATGVVQVQRESNGGLGLSEVFDGQGVMPDALTTGMDIETQANILQSDSLALQVIHELNLDKTREFRTDGFLPNLINALEQVDGNSEPARRTHAVKVFSKNLKVKVESGTRLIDITYRSPDPVVAAQVVNHLIEGLVGFNVHAQQALGAQTSEWLTSQLGDLRKQSEDLQAKVLGLQQQMGVFSLGGTQFNGSQLAYSTVLNQVEQASTELAAAQSNRILKGAVYQVAKSGNPELISGLAGNSFGSASPALTNSLALIQNLREQEATLDEDIAHDAAKFGANYPPLVEKRAALAGLDKSIAAEQTRIAARAQSDYKIAEDAETSTENLLNSARQDADRLNSKTIEYAIAQKQADETRNLYEDLTKRLREAGLVQGLRSSNIVTVDPGRTPAKPSSPKLLLTMAAAIALGLFLGSAGAMLLDISDKRVQTVDEIEYGNLPLLGIVPYLKSARRGYLLEDAASLRSEFHQAMRGLRTALSRNRALPSPKVVLVTSALPGEGKSTIAKGLSVAAAQQGRKVLLIEADLYRPRLRNDLELDERGGLSLMLQEPVMQPEENLVTPMPRLPNFRILQAGRASAETLDLLESSRMSGLLETFRNQFDLIVMDGPPMLPVTDAVPLSMLADTTVVVARLGQTPRVAFTRAVSKLQMHIPRCDVRVALNAVKSGSYAFYNYYGSASVRYPKEEQHAGA